ncbi:MAG: DUF1549 and DUF1553 domain-containing protein [Pirellula sp.]
MFHIHRPLRFVSLMLGITLALALCDDSICAQSELNLLALPSQVNLQGNFSQAQLLVRLEEPASPTNPNNPEELARDLTSQSQFESLTPQIVKVSASGSLTTLANGPGKVRATYEGKSVEIPVEVSGIVDAPQVDFQRDLLPLITRSGCNAGACHASQYGKGGLVLSVMAFDPMLDYQSLALGARSRRINTSNPHESLLLKKATGTVAHGGGARFPVDSNDYRILARWIQLGAPKPDASAKKVTRLEIQPKKRVVSLTQTQQPQTQQLRVVATYEDGQVRDVTAWTRFDAMDESVVKVSSSGLAQTVGKGQGAVMARFADHAEISTFVIPFSDSIHLDNWVSFEPMDDIAKAKFEELKLTPSGLCDDATFLRRAFLDAIGALPSVEESRAFLSSNDPKKREVLIDRLLGLSGDTKLDTFNDQYAAYWSLKWSDLIRNNSAVLGESGMWALHNWMRESFRTNKPMGKFVSELITAKGSIFSNGPANYYRIANNPPDLAESTAQLFLGTRLQCAKCHHHPYERYSQDDYYGFAAFFARVASKNSAEFGIFGGETVVVVNSGGEVTHPKTGAVMKPTPLKDSPLEHASDRRIALADWLTGKENTAFARNMVNRYTGYLLGRGLVEPIDDMRSTNPPSNPQLMDHLVNEFQQSGFDVRHLMRTIMRSRLYQLDSQPNEHNAEDTRFYSHYRVKRIAAESLLDCIDDATMVRTKHPNMPLGKRAVELPDAATNNTNPFLVTFGKTKRASVCECERTPDENLAQALHTLNGDIVSSKIADGQGRVATLVTAGKPTDICIEELYLATLCRGPSTDELAQARSFVMSCPSPAEGYQDLLWALINSKQFLFIR